MSEPERGPRPAPGGVRVMAVVVAVLLACDVAVAVARAGDHGDKPATSRSTAVRQSTTVSPSTTTTTMVPATDLAAVLIPPPPGYVEVAAGVNGEVSADQLASFANLGLDAANLPSGVKGSELSDLHLRAFGHTWANQVQGRVLVVLLLQFNNAAFADAADAGAKSAMGKLSGATPFATTTVPRSYGVTFDQPAAGAGTVHIRGVFFTKGTRLAVVDLGGLRDTPSAEEAIALAKQQFDRL